MASALALQCSTNWAMKTHILGAGQFIEFILTRDRKYRIMMWTAEIQMKWRIHHRSYDRNLSNCKFKPEKKTILGFNGIRTHGLWVSAAVLYQLSYEDPYIGSRPIYRVHLNPWQEYRIKMMWTAEIQMKWRFDHRSYDRNLSNCKFKPEKNFGLQRVSNPWPLR